MNKMFFEVVVLSLTKLAIIPKKLYVTKTAKTGKIDSNV